MNPVMIGSTPCGATAPVYVAFEIGGQISNVGEALDLVQAAVDAGADAVKVQIIDPRRLVGEDRPFAYRDAGGEQTRSLLELLLPRALEDKEWAEVARLAKVRGLGFLATVDFPETLALALEIGTDALKVPSGDVTHLGWIRQMARAQRPLMIDTGNASFGEIEAAVDAAWGEQVPGLILHHVGGGYPADPGAVHLRMLDTIRQAFPEVVPAFSCHSPGWEVDCTAIALGARMIEKNLTLRRDRPGPESLMAVEVGDEARRFVDAMRAVDLTLGSLRRPAGPLTGNKVAARRSAFTRRPMARGEMVQARDIEWRRPGDGVQPGDEIWLYGRPLTRDVPAGHKILWTDLA